MSDAFYGEIKMFAFNWAPKDWSKCDGQEMPIAQNQALFSLLGIQFGGDGRTTFQLPDLRGRTPIHKSSANGLVQGAIGGFEEVTLSLSELPDHTHTFQACDVNGDRGGVGTQGDRMLAIANAVGDPELNYGVPSNLVLMKEVSSVGGGQSHTNLQPSAVINYCIAIDGLYPSRN